MTDGRPEFRAAPWQAPAYAAIWAAALAMVWVLPALPTQDGPSHVHFLRVLSDLLAERGPWDDAYRVDVQLRPYLGLLAIGLPLANVLPMALVERAIVTVYCLLLAIGVPALLRAFGRPALPLAFLAVPMAFGMALFMGFYPYCLAAALFLGGLAPIWRWRSRPIAVRSAVTTALVLLVWTMHLVPATFLLAASALVELARPRRAAASDAPPSAGGAPDSHAPARARRAAGVRARFAFEHIATAAVVAAPGLVVVVILTVPHIVGAASSAAAWHPLAVRAFFLATFGSVALGLHQLAIALALLGWLLACLPVGRPGGDHAARFLGAVALMLVAATLLLPNAGLGGGYVNERIPWLIPLVLAPLLRPPTAWCLGALRAAHGPFLAALAAASLALTAAYAWPPARDIQRLRAGLAADLKPGATVLLARYAPRPLWPLHDPMLHAASLYGARGLVDAGYVEADIAYFPVRLLPRALAGVDTDAVYRRPRTVHWGDDRTVDYLLAWGAEAADAEQLGQHFTRVWEAPGNPLTIWRR